MVKDYILIAEDDEDDQFLLKSAFSEIDYNVDLVFVNNGIDLLNHFREVDNGSISKLPLLLVVDLNMPKKNGKEAIRELSTRQYFKDFTTIIFSTTSNDAEKNKCRELGVNDFFVKPSNYKELIEVVNTFKTLAVTGDR
jgi:DNA-binding response OmpR family regulator